MISITKIYHIICEGSSEEAYLQELNRYLRECNSRVNIKVYNLCGSGDRVSYLLSKIKNIYKKIRKGERKTPEIFIWIDNDLFLRKKLSKEELELKIKKLKGILGVKYNYHNFEDFLIMHLPDKQVQNFHKICTLKNHFVSPLSGEDVIKIMQKIIPDYKKGHLPDTFEITTENLNRLNENQNSATIKFKSDFVSVIEKLI
jgi:hypothetical protein